MFVCLYVFDFCHIAIRRAGVLLPVYGELMRNLCATYAHSMRTCREWVGGHRAGDGRGPTGQ